MSKKIYVIGSSNTDMVVKSEKLPVAGETILGGTFLMNAGGKGANQAVAAAKLGANVTFVSKVGDDIFGKQAIQGFQKEGINTNFVFTDAENPSGVALILVDAKGENSIAVASGANGNLQISEVAKAIEQISANDIVLLQLEIPIPTVEFAIKKCSENGAKVILNPAPAQKLNENIFKFLEIITPNETEAELLTGIKVTDLESAKHAAEVLHQKGVKNIIITLGSRGAYLYNTNTNLLISAPQVQAVDTTAAGDVFNGALAVALSEGNEMEQAINFACKAAAISVTRMGAQASAPLRSEINF
ncbi:ribokinase [Emticicia oligotrophica DSM 17448]|uniref:Ribokinase n=1 Tax=Emticicia oligotrophica (strain DSM 17448 / CIP 109782 / MTCC 6937 / GPTSA100-15) TaxID=929562 RepID=A0ABN4AIJ9_EMTOG|nr:ribokinase [Emticicia oligotrophica]AFK01940.1 ribokinase [Emticicia oligotrophica DSM 17448]